MKLLFLGLLFVCASLESFGQEPPVFARQTPDKPMLFQALPAKLAYQRDEIDKIFLLQKNDSFSIRLTGKFLFNGIVIDRVQKSNQLLAMNLRVSNYPGALFNISRLENDDHSSTITGRIIHPKYGDVLILTKENNEYFLVKRPQRFFMSE